MTFPPAGDIPRKWRPSLVADAEHPRTCVDNTAVGVFSTLIARHQPETHNLAVC